MIRRHPGGGTPAVPFLASVYSVLYGGFIGILSRLPDSRAQTLARSLMPLVMLPFRSRLRMNLKRFGGETSAVIEKLHLDHLARLTAAFALLPVQPAGELKRRLCLEGEEHLGEALREGKGVLLVTDHFGNGWHSLAALSSRGYRLNLLLNHLPLPALDRQVGKICAALGISLVRPGPDAYLRARESLRRNELFFLAFDAGISSKNSLMVPFGRSGLSVQLGLGILPFSTHAPTLRITNCHLPSGESRTAISLPSLLPPLSDPRSDASALLRSWVRELELKTSSRPEEWSLWSYVSLPPDSAGIRT